MGDEGIGIASLRRLRERWTFEPEVLMVDGGTWGMDLLPLVEDAVELSTELGAHVHDPPEEAVRLAVGRLEAWGQRARRRVSSGREGAKAGGRGSAPPPCESGGVDVRRVPCTR